MKREFDRAPHDAKLEIVELERALQDIRTKIEAQRRRVDANWAAELYRQRRDRNAIFGSEAGIFGEPAWDILLDLMAAKLDGRRISVSSACIAADVAPTTALRYLTRLEERGLIQRRGDPLDRRRHYVELTESTILQLAKLQVMKP